MLKYVLKITSKSDIIVSFDEEYLDPVISQKKTYEFRSWRADPEVKRMWIYVNRPIQSLMYIFELDIPVEYPNQIPNNNVYNETFNQGKNPKWKFACRIKHLYKLNEPIGMKNLKAKYGIHPPQKLTYVSKYPQINEEKGYGPCKNTLCGCSCSSNTCVCLRADLQAEPDLSGMYASGRAKDGNLSGQAGHYVFGNRKEHGEGRILSSTFGGEIGKDGIKAKLGVDLINVKTEGIQARVGLNVDSGISTSNDTFEAKLGGVGLSVGKQTGISTPFGEVKVDTEDCVIQ